VEIGTTVYAICNPVTGEAYIGETVDVASRWYEHRRRLSFGIHHNSALQAAWSAMGSEVFTLAILERVDRPLAISQGERWVKWQQARWCQKQEARWCARARAAGVVLYNDQVGRGRRVAA